LIKSTATAVLASVITKRKQFHSNIIGQSVMLSREEVRNRIAQTTNYSMVVCTENLYPRIAVMESAEDGERFDASSSLDRARNRRIFVQ
jgi:hypothetical protein